MQDDTKLPAWLARRGYSARLKRRLARGTGARPIHGPPETEAEGRAGPRASGAIILPFTPRGRRAPVA